LNLYSIKNLERIKSKYPIDHPANKLLGIIILAVQLGFINKSTIRDLVCVTLKDEVGFLHEAIYQLEKQMKEKI
jgi:hypothetical protein